MIQIKYQIGIAVNTTLVGERDKRMGDNGKMETMTIQDIRKRNLASLIEAEFQDNGASLARAMGVAPSSVYRLLSESKGSRNISDKNARLIEAAANKEKGWLDRLHSLQDDPELDQLYEEAKALDAKGLKEYLLIWKLGKSAGKP